MARLQRSLAQCHDMIVRRGVVVQALAPRAGECILEFGCGGGYYARDVAEHVGSTGRVCAIDISEDQIAAASAHCVDFRWVECKVANILDLPYDDMVFEAVYGVQALEYVTPVDGALQQIRRVLRSGGRFVNFATNWSSVVWHSTDPTRMKRVLAA